MSSTLIDRPGVKLQFSADPSAFDAAGTRVFLGRRSRLLDPDVRARVPAFLRDDWEAFVRGIDPGDEGSTAQAWSASCKVIVGVIAEKITRYNTPTGQAAIARLAAGYSGNGVAILVALAEPEHAWSAAMAVAQAWPTVNLRSATPKERVVNVLLLTNGRALPSVEQLALVADARRRAAAWVDAPPSHFHVAQMVAEARRVAEVTRCAVSVVEGPALAAQGLGGLWAVGKAAEGPPAMVVLEYAPPAARGPSVGLVGKGIVYDTGGLSLKGKFDMPGMKNDLGGAAAVLAAFEAAVRLRLPRRIVAVLCLAENAVGPAATRPDDVITLFSGRTVEVNNTDAEGRLVLADGLSWLIKHHRPDQVIDLATLTGAQLVATGRRHAAIVSPDEALEARAVDIGRRSGDLVHPLPFAPELFRREFQSSIADMKNSVKDRSNAQSSCAAQFLFDHLTPYDGAWLHVDMAGPVMRDGRGTGYGVGLILGLLGLFDPPVT